jgi:NhaP-type Na+/H+ or K+/H+ antiporter
MVAKPAVQPPRSRPVLALVLLAGAAVAVAIGVYGRVHEAASRPLFLLGFSGMLQLKAWLATLALVLVLFTDAVTLETGEIRKRRRLAWRMLVPGTLIPATLTALASRWLLALDWTSAAILGAALASTDPVILRSLLRSPALPPTTRVALRLETGMNDVALVPVIVVALLLAGVEGGGGDAVRAELGRHLLGLFVLGPGIGAAVGWIGIAMLVQVRTRIGVRRDYESLYALGLALSAFALAEAAGGSGFLAAFTAGLMVALQDVELCDCFLEYGEATAEMLMLLTFVAFGASLLWTGLAAANLQGLAVAAIAIGGRSLVLYPMLGGMGIARRDRWLITLLGPRGLSALLLVLLPVFEGMPGAERLFVVTAFTVLLSVIVHGTGIALFLRRGRAVAGPTAPAAPQPPASGGPAPSRELPVLPSAATQDTLSPSATTPHVVTAPTTPPQPLSSVDPLLPEPERISVDDLHSMLARGASFIPVDVRAERSYRASDQQAAGAIRLPPEDPVRAAESMRLHKHATLVLYCA